MPDTAPAAAPTTAPAASSGARSSDAWPTLALTALRLLTAALVITGLYAGQELLMPLALAGLLAFVLAPVVAWVRRLLPESAAVVLTVGMALAATLSLGALAAAELAGLAEQTPRYQAHLRAKLADVRADLGHSGALSSTTRLLDTVDREVEATRRSLTPPGAQKQAPMRVVVEAQANTGWRALRDQLRPMVAPLLSTGFVVVLLIFVLLERRELRDRLLRLAGGDPLSMSQALDEAATRVSRYLGTQLLINLGYGTALGLGLWALGLPGALLFGALGAALRFMPYVGPLIASALPAMLAVVADPGWSMVLWTLGLVLVLEVVINNIVEPLFFGASTGMSAVAILLAAVFWTGVWGPIGLMLSTPLTVFAMVVGRHVRGLRILQVLLGSEPAFDAPTRLHQRLSAGQFEEALELANQEAAQQGLAAFYGNTALPALAMAQDDDTAGRQVVQRHRLMAGTERLIEELRSEHPGTGAGAPAVLCIGLRWMIDGVSAQMLAHALDAQGIAARTLGAMSWQDDLRHEGGAASVRLVCLVTFQPAPEAQVRYAAKRLRRLLPGVTLMLAQWQRPHSDATPADRAAALGLDLLVHDLGEALERAQHRLAALPATLPAPSGGPQASPPPDTRPTAAAASAARRAAELFGMRWGVVLWRNGAVQAWSTVPEEAAPDWSALWHGALLPTCHEPCALADLARTPCADTLPDVRQGRLRALRVVPLRAEGGSVDGVLAVLDDLPREPQDTELAVLATLAEELVQQMARQSGADLAPPAAAARHPLAALAASFRPA